MKGHDDPGEGVREPTAPLPPSAPASPPDLPPAIPEREERTVACDLCGAPVLERHCKIVCRNCGYTRDCSDP